ncbi:hypothetical protein [Streptomyces griseoaurantiacus]|uniref:hypothetical protein n=1 Tax=Streptomyces griseoaurantiacus TaxID=68213 RepID=UPI0036B50D2B
MSGSERKFLVELNAENLESVRQAARLVEAVERARLLGWRTVSVARLVHIAEGDQAAMLPDPVSTCPGRETEPNRCKCPCQGCRHNCAAHDPATV